MRYSTTRSKAIQLSVVLTLSAIVSGCAASGMSAVTAELSPIKADEPEITQDAEGHRAEYYADQQRFFESEFDYDDAVVLGIYWGESLEDSKARIGDKLEAANGVEVVNEILEKATLAGAGQEISYHPEGHSAEYYSDQQRFFESEFDYDDAALLSTYWGESVGESKARIGDKLEAANGVAIVNEILGEATLAIARPDFEPLTRKGPVNPDRQVYLDSSFDYYDAELLAEFWGVDIDDAKIRIGSLLRRDEGFDVVTEALQQANRASEAGSEPELSFAESRQVYIDSDFSYDDAVLLSAFWGIDVDDSKIRMGQKIHFNGVDFLAGIVDEAEREAAADGDRIPNGGVEEATYQRERNAYFNSDYTYNDAVLLADFWGMEINTTKARMGRKILWGAQDIQVLNDFLQQATAAQVLNPRTEG